MHDPQATNALDRPNRSVLPPRDPYPLLTDPTRTLRDRNRIGGSTAHSRTTTPPKSVHSPPSPREVTGLHVRFTPLSDEKNLSDQHGSSVPEADSCIAANYVHRFPHYPSLPFDRS